MPLRGFAEIQLVEGVESESMDQLDSFYADRISGFVTFLSIHTWDLDDSKGPVETARYTPTWHK